jgi:hypothetical protein
VGLWSEFVGHEWKEQRFFGVARHQAYLMWSVVYEGAVPGECEIHSSGFLSVRPTNKFGVQGYSRDGSFEVDPTSVQPTTYGLRGPRI